MSIAHWSRSLAPIRRCGLAILALIILGTGSGLVAASQGTDESEMTVSIVPGPGGTASAEGDVSAGDGKEQTSPAGWSPGTITAMIAVTDGTGEFHSLASPLDATLTVSDERGTARGWDVLLAAPTNGRESVPVLIENRRHTVSRIMPVTLSSTAEDAGVVTGGVLGPIPDPVLVFQAGQGSGAGVYRQQLVFLLPPANEDWSTFAIQLPFAP